MQCAQQQREYNIELKELLQDHMHMAGPDIATLVGEYVDGEPDFRYSVTRPADHWRVQFAESMMMMATKKEKEIEESEHESEEDDFEGEQSEQEWNDDDDDPHSEEEEENRKKRIRPNNE